MRWVEAPAEFERILLDAQACVFIDSGRAAGTALQRLTFDDADICTRRFGAVVLALMRWSCDNVANYIVLRPDPVYYFNAHFNRYPVLEISQSDSTTEYLDAMNQDPGGSPPDAVGSNWWECVFVPPSRQWFVHALRSSESNGGHIWIPPAWQDKLREIYPQAASSASHRA